MKKTIVVALGGNALGKTPDEQKQLVKDTAKPIVDLIEVGNKVVLAHGNGPQVGMINLAFETSANSKEKTPKMPFPECGAMSQAYIGYHLQNALLEELKNRKIEKSVLSVVSQVLVDENDEAFKNPSKPIGAFYTEDEAKKIAKEKSYTMKEDSNRGYRRVVASPKPVDVIEKDSIKKLVEQDAIVITVGGGGIPVVKKGNSLIGVDAVIDKDFASSKLAELVDADMLIVLTAVEKIAINFGKENQEDLSEMTVEKAREYASKGHFAPGSMLPKVEAAISFVEGKSERVALITSLEKAKEAIDGKTGTLIFK